ncbi:MAG: DUF2959 family protein [Bacteroidota bacterium]
MLSRVVFLTLGACLVVGCGRSQPTADDLDAPIETSTLERVEISESDYATSVRRSPESWRQLATLLEKEVDTDALRAIELLSSNGEQNVAQLRDHRRRVDALIERLLSNWNNRLEQYADSTLRGQSAALRKDVEATYAAQQPRFDAALDDAQAALAALNDRERLALDLLIVQVMAGLDAYADTYEASAEDRTARMRAQIAEADSLLTPLRD